MTLSAVLPAYLESSSAYSVAKDGLVIPGGGYIRTRKGDFLERNFVFEVWLAKDDKMGAGQIGVGSGLDDLSNSVFLIVERRKVYTSIRRDKAKSIEDPGDYVARIEKKGTSVTFRSAPKRTAPLQPTLPKRSRISQKRRNSPTETCTSSSAAGATRSCDFQPRRRNKTVQSYPFVNHCHELLLFSPFPQVASGGATC